MNNYTTTLCKAFLLALLIGLNSACTKDSSPRISLNMNTDWAFYRGDIQGGEKTEISDAGWIPAVVPHIMQLEKKHCGGNSIYDGIGWYRRYFKLLDTYKDKRVAVSFEGVMTGCELFVNGTKVTEHKGGYVGFTADISPYIKWGENNLLAVRVSAEYDSLTPPAKPQDRLDFYYYSGIYRDVNMIISDKLHITDELEVDKIAGGGLFITYPKVDQEEAWVQVQTHLKNGHAEGRTGTILSLLKDDNGKVVVEEEIPFTLSAGQDCTLKQTLQVKQPKLWHPYTPNLYRLESRVLVEDSVVDSRTETIGIRTIRYTCDEGLYINGERLYLYGTNRRLIRM